MGSENGQYRVGFFPNITLTLLTDMYSNTERKQCQLKYCGCVIKERLKRLRQERYDQQHEDQAQRELIHSQIDKNLEKIRKIERDAKQVNMLLKVIWHLWLGHLPHKPGKISSSLGFTRPRGYKTFFMLNSAEPKF